MSWWNISGIMGEKDYSMNFWPEANWEVGVLSLTAMSENGWHSFKVKDWNSVLVMVSLR